MATLSTHVLSSVTGDPAAGMAVRLDVWDGGSWAALGAGTTDADGRLRDFGVAGLESGQYQLTFETGAWFGDQPCFYPTVSIAFVVNEDRHYHVPLLLAPYAYSTYRGS